MARTPVGFRLREQRRKRGLTQAALAAEVGISASYLNLIEHGRREVAGALLRRLAGVVGIDLEALSGVEDDRLVNELAEIAADPRMQDLHLEPGAAQEIVGRHVGWGRALVRLHRANGSAILLAETLADRLAHDSELVQASHALITRITSVRAFAEILSEHADLEVGRRRRFTAMLAEESERLGNAAKVLFERLSDTGPDPTPATPAQEVDDFIIDRRNYFPALEEAAARMSAGLPAAGLEAVLRARLVERHGVGIEAPAAESEPARPAGEPSPIRFAIGTPPATVRFEMARRLFLFEERALLDRLVADRRLTSPEARRRAREALAGYGAGALLLPYDPFRDAAEQSRYDLDRLAALFDASFEQVCHRLVTLRRPGAEGIPFAFLRVDPAGNISKRFGLPNLRLPRHGGACPLWAIYRAFQTPGALATQRLRLPDRREFLFIARTVIRPSADYGAAGRIHSVMIGCDAVHAARIVYGRTGIALEGGINCHLCPRQQCPQRAFPSALP